MATAGTRLIEAAGGVLWRPAIGGLGVEVALVHRPKYDDWSLPKGKLTEDEHPILAAVREVFEETGFSSVPGRPLGQIRYLKDGVPKRVRYWALRAENGSFTPSEEVDQIMWLPPREGQRHLIADRDRPILAEYEKETDPTWPCLLIRHGSAGERSEWTGDDRERPLDDQGRTQAVALVQILRAFLIRRVLSADVLRCLDTVGPYAAGERLTVESEPLMSETGVQMQPDAAADRLVEILATREAVAVCSQGRAMPHLIAEVCRRLDFDVPSETSTRKGGFWVLHLAANGKARLVGLERFPPPA